MIHGAFYFRRMTGNTASRMEIASAEVYNRSAGYSYAYFKQSVTRHYEMKTGNNFAAFPGWVVTPGARPFTSMVAPWYYASAVLTVPATLPAATTDVDTGPIFRERLYSIEIQYGENGVATAMATTISNSPTLSSNPFIFNQPWLPVLTMQGGNFPMNSSMGS